MSVTNNSSLTQAINNVNSSSFPNYQIGGIKIDTNSLTSTESAVGLTSTTATPVSSETESLYATPMSQWSKVSGFTVVETNPPQLPGNQPNNKPAVGAPSSPWPLSRGVNLGTGIDVANKNITFECNFILPAQINSCLFDLDLTISTNLYRVVRKAWWVIRAQFPWVDLIESTIEEICRILSQIMKVLCFIKQLIMCIVSTIQSIVSLITWIISLPVRFVTNLMQCVSAFLKIIENALTSMISSLAKSFGGASQCSGFSCNTANSLYSSAMAAVS